MEQSESNRVNERKRGREEERKRGREEERKRGREKKRSVEWSGVERSVYRTPFQFPFGGQGWLFDL